MTSSLLIPCKSLRLERPERRLARSGPRSGPGQGSWKRWELILYKHTMPSRRFPRKYLVIGWPGCSVTGPELVAEFCDEMTLMEECETMLAVDFATASPAIVLPVRNDKLELSECLPSRNPEKVPSVNQDVIKSSPCQEIPRCLFGFAGSGHHSSLDGVDLSRADPRAKILDLYLRVKTRQTKACTSDFRQTNTRTGLRAGTA